MGRFSVCAAVLMAALMSGTAMSYSTSIITRVCSSTGSALEYSVWGYATDAYGRHYDSCVNSTHVRKWSCENGFAASKVRKCPLGCLAGECTLETANNWARGYECTATDQYRNTQTRGTVDGNMDKCVNSALLKKWYCWRNQARYAMVNCPYGCVNGACRPSGEKNGYDKYQYLSVSS